MDSSPERQRILVVVEWLFCHVINQSTDFGTDIIKRKGHSLKNSRTIKRSIKRSGNNNLNHIIGEIILDYLQSFSTTKRRDQGTITYITVSHGAIKVLCRS